MPINYLSHADFVHMGILPEQATKILDLRSKHGNITQELFESSDIPGAQDIVGKFIFFPLMEQTPPAMPGPSASSPLDAEDEFFVRSEVGSSQDGDAKGVSGDGGGQARGASPYPHDVYPPPREGHKGPINTGFPSPRSRTRGASRASRDPHDVYPPPREDPPDMTNADYPSVSQRHAFNGHRSAQRRGSRENKLGRPYNGYGPGYDPSASDSQEYEEVRVGQRGHQRHGTPRGVGTHASPGRRGDAPDMAPHGKGRNLADFQPIPKTVNFNGTGNWHAFYRKFDALANTRCWSPAQRLTQLCWCLDGKASDFLEVMMNREPDLQFGEVLYRFTKRYGHQEPVEAAQVEFGSARQRTEETLSEWADRLNDVSGRAFPDVPERALQRQMVLRLCQGCIDKEAGCYALDRHPPDLDGAVEAIRWYQHSRRAVYGRNRQVKAIAFDSEDEGEPRVRRVDNPPFRRDRGGTFQGPPLTKLEGRVANLEGLVERIVKKLDSLEKKLDSLAPMEKGPEQSERRTSHNAGVAPSPPEQWPTCFFCKGKGHFKKDCPRWKAEKRVAFVETEESGNSSGSEGEEGTLRPEEVAHMI